MPYSTDNPPQVLVPSIGSRPTLWSYQSADDDATVNGSDYFENGGDLGMKEGDFVLAYDTTNDVGSAHVVTGVSGGAATTAFVAVA